MNSDELIKEVTLKIAPSTPPAEMIQLITQIFESYDESSADQIGPVIAYFNKWYNG